MASEEGAPGVPDPTPEQAAHPRAPLDLVRDRRYVVVLVMGALLGVPVALVAYFFLKWVAEVQQYVFTTLPADLGFNGEPAWWPIPPLIVSGVLVGLTIKHLPGTAGHEPSEGFKTTGPVRPIDLPGIIIASFATLSLGVVLGPEAPLIAIGSGMGALAIRLLRKDAPAQAVMVISGAASFAAISTLLGSPLAGAFLLMEAAGLGGPMLGVVLLPGLLAAGVGSLIFIGLDQLTGFGTFSLSVPDIPAFTTPTVGEFAWAIGIGLAAAILGTAIKRLGLWLQPIVAKRRTMVTPAMGLAIGICALVFAEATDRSPNEVLFSGQSALPALIENAAGWTVGALVVLIICKGLAYGAALSAFRGGPTFPGMFIGGAAGIALSHLPGLPMIAGVAIGIGAMTTVMLGLPLTSVLLTALFLSADAVPLMPLVIVGVVVAYVASARLAPVPAAADGQPRRSRRADMSDPARTVSRRPVRRLLLAFINLNSFGSVMVFIFATYVLSVTVTASWGRALVLVVQIATVWLALRVSHARRVIRLAASIALAVALAVAVLSLVGVGDSNLSGAVFLTSGILYLIAPVSIVRSLITQPQVDQETVLGALDAYLFVGMAFAYLYATLGAFDPPFFQGGGSDTVPNTLFFSFTTLTTTGYGNLVPAANPGQSLAVLEMLIGQLFLVTAVAKVINAWRPARWQGDRPEGPSTASPEGSEGG